MKRRLFLVALCLLPAFYLGCSLRPEEPASTEPFLVAQARRVRPDRLRSHMAALTAIPTRYMHWDPGRAATQALLLDVLAEQGTPALLDSFSFFRFRWIETANIEVFFEGKERPGRELLVGAHWDTVDWPESIAGSTLRAAGFAQVDVQRLVLPTIFIPISHQITAVCVN